MCYKYNPEVSVIIFGRFHCSSEFRDYRELSSDDVIHPPVDIVQKGGSIYIWMELPGVPDSDIDVFFHKGMLVVCGIKRATAVDFNGAFLRVERQKSPFCRFFILDRPVDFDSVRTSLEDGVLAISWRSV